MTLLIAGALSDLVTTKPHQDTPASEDYLQPSTSLYLDLNKNELLVNACHSNEHASERKAES